jgi:hypothetical protein
MNTLLLSVLIGLVAGTLDIIPMLIKKLPMRATISAFLQYLFVSVIIVHIDLPHIPWWIEAGLVAVMMTIPIVIIIAGKDRKSVPIILANAIILGTLIGIAAHYLVVS